MRFWACRTFLDSVSLYPHEGQREGQAGRRGACGAGSGPLRNQVVPEGRVPAAFLATPAPPSLALVRTHEPAAGTRGDSAIDANQTNAPREYGVVPLLGAI